MSASYGVHRVEVGRFCGPERADGGNRRMVSLYAVTGLHGDGGEPLELTPDQAIQVANAIVLAAQDTELTEYVIRNAGSEDDSAEPLRFSPECARELAGALMGAAQAAEPEPA